SPRGHALRRPPRAARVALLLVAASSAFAAERASLSNGSVDAVVVRVVDGDTIVVRIGDRTEKVRYIGVNTPEIHHPRRGEEPGGRAAARVNGDLVWRKTVRLELDVRERDRYRRLLAYVWVGDTMVNAE